MHEQGSHIAAAARAALRRHMIVVHLVEASRLAAGMKGQLDVDLFRHLLDMAVYVAHEHEADPDGEDFHEEDTRLPHSPLA